MKRLQSNDTADVRYNDWTDGFDDDDDNDNDLDQNDVPTEILDEPEPDPTAKRLMNKLIEKYKKEFQTYCRRAVCIGFNSGKLYDINLIRKTLIKQLGMHLKTGNEYVIKRNNNYQCIANDKLKFLDMVNYLPPGTSYAGFLKTFNQVDNKAFFPYEYLSDLSVLQETCLPPPHAFYSSLKQQNVLESDIFVKYCM